MNSDLIETCLTQYSLCSTEKFILFVLCVSADPISLEACVPQEKISLLTSLNRKTVSKCIQSLQQKKILIYENKLSGKTNTARIYKINMTKQEIPTKKHKSRNLSHLNKLKITIKLCKAHGYKCQICGFNEDLELDHIIPISKGGSDAPENLQLLCRSCNSRKSDKT